MSAVSAGIKVSANCQSEKNIICSYLSFSDLLLSVCPLWPFQVGDIKHYNEVILQQLVKFHLFSEKLLCGIKKR